ncbi:MAG: hypothetical protein ACF8PN_01555 [Phycisphaerales bacterium]
MAAGGASRESGLFLVRAVAYALRMRNLAKTILAGGLALCVASFTMIDRGWLADAFEPLGFIAHPAAAIVGLGGLVLCLVAAAMLRRTTPL